MSAPVGAASPATAGATPPALSVGVDGQPPDEGSGLPLGLVRNVGATYMTHVAQAISGLIMAPLLIHYVGTESFGVWSLALAVVGYLNLFELGFGAATSKLVAEDAYVRPERVARTVNTSFLVLGGFGVVAAVVAVVVAQLAPALFSIPAGLEAEATVVFLVLGLATAIAVPGDVFGATLVGYQRFDLLAAVNASLVVLMTVMSAVVLVLGFDIVAVALVGLILTAGTYVVFWRVTRRLVPELRISRRLVDPSRIRKVATMSGWFMLQLVAHTVSYRIDLIVVGFAFGLREVALFALGGKLVAVAGRAVYPLANALFPHAAALSAGDDRRRLSALLLDGTRTTMLVGLPLAVVLITLAQKAMLAWVGPGYAEAANVLMVGATVVALSSISAASWEVLTGSGKIRQAAILAIVEAVANLSLSLLFLQWFGLIGVALGTLVGFATINLPVGLYMGCKLTDVSAGRLWRESLRPHVVPVVVTGAALSLVRLVIPGEVLPVVAAGAAGLALYEILYYFVSANPTERRMLSEKLGGLRARIRPARAG